MQTDESRPTIVVGVDESDDGRDALALARMLARLRGGARLVAAAVYRRERPVYPGSDALEADLRATAERSLEDVVGVGDGPVQMRTVPAPSPARGLHELAEATGAEFVVVGSTHRGGLGRVLPGSTGERLLQESPCAVAIAPLGYAAQAVELPRVVAAGYDLTDESDAALELAAELAGAAEATIRILTVDEPRTGRYGDLMYGAGGVAAYSAEDIRERMRTTVMRERDELPSALRADAKILAGVPAQELLEELDRGVDLMVMGSRGYGPIGRALLGSVSREVVRAAGCPVVIVPRAAAHRDNPRPITEAAAEQIRAP